MKLGTIYYIIPDIFSEKFRFRMLARNLRQGTFFKYIQRCVKGSHRPVGSVKIHYLHCMKLLEGGIVAKPLIMGKFSGDFFEYNLESSRVKDTGFKLNKNDVVISTEFFPYDGLLFENCIKVMFVQGWIFIGKRLKSEDKGKSYLDLGYDHVITCSNYNTSQVNEVMGIPADTITNGIDQDVFYPNSSIREEYRVLCLPRRNKQDMVKIQNIVKARCPKVNFVEVDDIAENQMAVEFRKSDIFLATGYPEGFSLPPLEAMCSGCMVVGFSGKGGSEFMLHRDTALVVEDGDCDAAAECLIEALENKELKEQIRHKGIVIAQTYTPENMKSLLLDFFKKIENEH